MVTPTRNIEECGLKRKPVEMPASIVRLLKAANMENQAPEVTLGLLLGCTAHLVAAISEQWPEAWPVFQGAARRGATELLQVIDSANPRIALEVIVAEQRDTA